MNPFCERFGLLSEQDAQVLEATLAELAPLGKIKFLEIGMYQGRTGLGVKNWCDAHGVALDWWGLDSQRDTAAVAPFPEATIRVGPSEEIYPDIPNDFNAIIIDGCHCRNHVILDTYNYMSKVLPGGFLLFHDTGPAIQGNDYQLHGPRIPEFHIRTLDAFAMIGWPHPGWTLFLEKFDASLPFGGMQSYRRA